MSATDAQIGTAPYELDEDKGVSDSTLDHLREVQALIDAGETEDNIARFISGHGSFTTAERALARIVLRRHGLARAATA